MLHEAGAPRGRRWDHPPDLAGPRAGILLVAAASSLVTLSTLLVLLPALGMMPRPLVGPGFGAAPTGIQSSAPALEASADLSAIYERSAPAVVHVLVARVPEGTGNGSGFVVTPDGRIVTNHHVVDGARSLHVRLQDGRELPAEVIGRDPATDLALLQVEAGGPLPTLPLGDASALAVGQLALAIGSPFGFEQSLSVGRISALGRSIAADDTEGTVIDGAIQTDAAVNPGNSGGPLLDAEGRVIGVTTAIFSSGQGFEGVGFALPVDVLKGVLPELAERGYVLRPYLGLTGVDVTERMATMLSLPARSGVLVQAVEAGSPAERAGLQAGAKGLPFAEGERLSLGGDLIVAIDGRPVASRAELQREIARYAVGDALQLTVLRGEVRLELRGILGASRPPDS